MPPLPERIGKYEVRGKLGGGKMGVVYLAYDTVLEREVALKVMETSIESNEELRERFLQEAKAIARLANHPNIVSVIDFGYDDQGAPYIAMEHLQGRDLDWRLGHDPPKFVEKLEIIIQVLNGLAQAHEKGIVHRDIKPANIFITDSGGVKIMDFGVARLKDHSQTQTGVILGTAYYMSPEQIRASKGLDGRSDVFSVGVILYRLLTGKNPFEADNVEAIFFRILRADTPALAVDGRRVPELQRIVDRALAKNPAERYPDAESMAHDLRVFLEKYRGVVSDTICFQTVERQPSPHDHVPPPLPRPPRPPPVPVPWALPRVAMLLVGLGVTLGLAYYAFVNRPRGGDTTTPRVESKPPGPTTIVSGDTPPGGTPGTEPPPATGTVKKDSAAEELSASVAVATLASEVLTALNDGKLERAASLIDEGESRYPSAHNWADLRERLQRTRREREVQEEERRKAARVQHNLDQGYDHLGAGRYDEAVTAFEEVLELDPGNISAKRGMEDAQQRKNATEEPPPPPPPPPPPTREIESDPTVRTSPRSGSGFGPGATQITQPPTLDADLFIELEPANVRSGERYTLTVKLVNNSNGALTVQEIEIVSTFGQNPPSGKGKRLRAHSPRVDPHSTGILYQLQDTWRERMDQGRIEVIVYLVQQSTLQKSIHWN